MKLSEKLFFYFWLKLQNQSPKVNLKTNGWMMQGVVYGFKGKKQMRKSNAFYVL